MTDIASNVSIVQMAPNLQSMLVRVMMIDAVFACCASTLTKLILIVDAME